MFLLSGCITTRKIVKSEELYIQCINWEWIEEVYGGGKYVWCSWALDCPKWVEPIGGEGEYIPLNKNKCDDKEHCYTWQGCREIYRKLINYNSS